MIKDFDEGEGVPEDFRSQTEDGIQDWLAGRKGKQIHIYDVTQWRDIIHRCYFSCLRQRGEGPVSSISCATVSKARSPSQIPLWTCQARHRTPLSLLFCMPSQWPKNQVSPVQLLEAPLLWNCVLRSTCLARGRGCFSAPTRHLEEDSNQAKE